MGDVSATIPDWTREGVRKWWDPSRKLLRCVRDYQGIGRDGRQYRVPGKLHRRLIRLRHIFWTVISQADIPLSASIGGGLVLPHPVGIVVHPAAEIGPNCMIFQNVTLGTNRHRGAPRLGGHVDVGPGAQLIGPIVIGDHAVIGANAVVVSDVPPGAVVGGIPARILERPDISDDDPCPTETGDIP